MTFKMEKFYAMIPFVGKRFENLQFFQISLVSPNLVERSKTIEIFIIFWISNWYLRQRNFNYVLHNPSLNGEFWQRLWHTIDII